MRNEHNTSGRSTALLGGTVGLLAAGVIGFLAGRAIVRSRRRVDVRGQTVIVTGGSRGIGLEICRQLVQRGANVVLCARDETELRNAQDELTHLGGQTLAVTCDVTQLVDVANVVNQTIERFGRVDVLINNAGTIIAGPVSYMKLDDYREVMKTNFFGALHFVLQVMPDMRRQRSGRIVNIASFGGKFPSPHAAPYAASKHALVGFSETLRTELADDGVYVTTVNPGFTRVGSMQNAEFKGDHEKEKALGQTMGNMPLLSIDPVVLAKRIINALEHGDAELTTPLPYQLQAKFHGLLPGLNQEILSLVNRLLPGRTQGGDKPRVGRDVLADHLTAAWAKAKQRTAEGRYQRTDVRSK